MALVLLPINVIRGATIAQTDLASIAVTPLARQAGGKAEWQTLFDYSGGAIPPGGFITSEGKWIDPPVRADQSGVDFAFPDLPDNPANSQFMNIAFGYARPLANYPTRATVSYTSHFDQAILTGSWSPFTFRANNDERVLFGNLTLGAATHGGKSLKSARSGGVSTAPSSLTELEAGMPFKTVGDNTMVVTINAEDAMTVILNGQDATDTFGRRSKGMQKIRPSALLMNGLSIHNTMTQFPHNKGDWFDVHSFKIEQLRPPLEESSEAAIDLTVPGSAPIVVTIEVVDAWNDTKGFVLRDATISPGKYRLYWDGVDQKGMKAEDSAWVGAGSYTFRLTTGKTAVHYMGEINNSAPKYTTKNYAQVNVTALAMTPPGTVAVTNQPGKWKAENNANDTRKLDTTDSVQTVGTAYDAAHGQWICADGTVINTRCASALMQNGRALAITPPDPTDPTNPAKQFYFVSQNIRSGNAVISCGLPTDGAEEPPKTLTSPEWNRTKPGFVPYQIKIGQLPGAATLGPQKELFFETDQTVDDGKHGIDLKKLSGKEEAPKAPKEDIHAEFVFRNVRLYEEGQPDPGPVTFDPAQFATRGSISSKKADPPPAPLTSVSETAPSVPAKPVKIKPPAPIPPGSVKVEDNGHAVHLINAPTVNYPMNYTITPHTIMAFDLDVVDASKAGRENGIGLSPATSGSSKDDAPHYFHFLGGHSSNDPRDGFKDPALGAYTYPTYNPNTLYTDSTPLPPEDPTRRHRGEGEEVFLWQPGFYGLKISEDGKLLFACNNADNRLEVHDISTDGHTVAKIPIDYPMFVSFAPEGAAGARQGTRFVYVDSPKAGLLRIAWNLSDNTFGKPEMITPASEFAYPRGVVYDAAVDRIFVSDAFNLDRSKVNNQIDVIDPRSGKILSRFGKQGGVNPNTGGQIDDETFTCPLCIDADSKGALWVNDYYSCEMRKYDFDPASNGFKVERRTLGSNYSNTSHFFWMPNAPPTQVWTMADYFVRNEADIGADGSFTNQRTTSATYQLTPNRGRPFPHFCDVGGHIYAAISGQNMIGEQVGDGWVYRFAFGGASGVLKDRGGDAEDMARTAGLLAKPGEPPTDLDKAIAASGDADWATRPWTWSDLNGDGKMEYTKDNPEFQIDFNSKLSIAVLHSTCFRSSDGAYICPNNGKKDDPKCLLVVPPEMVNGKACYEWKNAKVIPCTEGPAVSDVLAQDGRFYLLRGSRGLGGTSYIECYDESGKLLWTRVRMSIDIQSLQSLGEGMFTVMDRGFSGLQPIQILTKDGDFVSQARCRDASDCWASGALRSDPDTGYIGLVQAYKVTGLSTVKSAAATVNLPRAGL